MVTLTLSPEVAAGWMKNVRTPLVDVSDHAGSTAIVHPAGSLATTDPAGITMLAGGAAAIVAGVVGATVAGVVGATLAGIEGAAFGATDAATVTAVPGPVSAGVLSAVWALISALVGVSSELITRHPTSAITTAAMPAPIRIRGRAMRAVFAEPGCDAPAADLVGLAEPAADTSAAAVVADHELVAGDWSAVRSANVGRAAPVDAPSSTAGRDRGTRTIVGSSGTVEIGALGAAGAAGSVGGASSAGGAAVTGRWPGFGGGSIDIAGHRTKHMRSRGDSQR